jgi:purine-binding chemotaxis protein CheW
MDMPVKLTRGALAVSEAQAGPRTQYLSFGLGRETFAMDIRSVKEVIQLEDITEVPLMPEFIRGVINLRGAVVPVLDLAVRFGRGGTEATRRTCIVVLEVEHRGAALELGMMVDNVCEVLEIGAADIEPAPAFGSATRSEFLAGVAKVEGTFILVLDVAHILALDEFAVLAPETAP